MSYSRPTGRPERCGPGWRRGYSPTLEKALDVFVRTAAEIRAILEKNPFSDREPRHSHTFFLQENPPSDALDYVRARAREETSLGPREIYVYLPVGMGQSKLVIPAARWAKQRIVRNKGPKLLDWSRKQAEPLRDPRLAYVANPPDGLRSVISHQQRTIGSN